jgi:hypothetical protein
MITSRLMLCAEAVIRDGDTNSISVFNILERITPEIIPFIMSKIVVLIVLEREEKDQPKVSAQLTVGMNGIDLLNLPMQLDFQNNKQTRTILTLREVKLSQAGNTELSFYVNNVLVNSYSIQIAEPFSRIK